IRGCTVYSPGCKNCYAMKQAHRFSGPGGTYEGLTRLTSNGPVWNGKVRFVEELLQEPLKWKKPRRVFVNSMSDLFHEKLFPLIIAKIFATMAIAKQHTFQILTKRAAYMHSVVSTNAFRDLVANCVEKSEISPCLGHLADDIRVDYWPLPNVWLGVSCENQKAADERIPLLLKTPAAVRWISAEPLLGLVDLNVVRGNFACHLLSRVNYPNGKPWLDWVVAGGESGPGARPFNIEWARLIVSQCHASGVPVFVKQLGAKPFFHKQESVNIEKPGMSFKMQSLEINSTFKLKDRKGRDMPEWPEDLQVRQFPQISGGK
ncbi:MAG TPA: phage Gp37/Gp68 family protein, partial [Candidatus Angelobacter sp.]|nr:phage Gp37/Gp68 family protein [Candidatus Angelobacter sp.]